MSNFDKLIDTLESLRDAIKANENPTAELVQAISQSTNHLVDSISDIAYSVQELKAAQPSIQPQIFTVPMASQMTKTEALAAQFLAAMLSNSNIQVLNQEPDFYRRLILLAVSCANHLPAEISSRNIY